MRAQAVTSTARVAMVAVVAGCGADISGADPGTADASTVQQYFNGEIFSGHDASGREWVLAAYNPTSGQVCMAYGPVEIQPDGSPGFDNLVVFTASVSTGTSTADGQPLLAGTLWYWNDGGNYWRSYAEYWYTYKDVEPTLKIQEDAYEPMLLTEHPADVSYLDMLSTLSPCKGFDESPTYTPEVQW